MMQNHVSGLIYRAEMLGYFFINTIPRICWFLG